MAAGDIYQVGPTSVAAAGFLAIRPASPTAVVVHNIYYAGAVELYWFDLTNQILFDSDGSAGARLNLTHHCSNGIFVRVKNVGSGAILIGADGIYTA